ncbi:NADPH-dependent diflavin oxidoreductase, putative [Rhizoctonia solani AG-3 Rhs1AP]|uniref:NADPH-dependent diflavin oxidoreductase, putative n=1 Tax=Rhizoctonia solani AG-3 Rhs1AP TaxID=1086054 RepID=X8JFT8_9AGAM|nr:NADPH-dependent diflavin oxidoreductase, putative [Rhizoctonia solani AG-3 Rhs1AP]
MIRPTITTGTAYPVLARYQACLLCRKRKQKCDATKPECQECLALGSKCQYENERYRTRTELLQNKIRELEEQIRGFEQRSSQSPFQAMDRTISRHGLSPGLPCGSSCSPASYDPSTPSGGSPVKIGLPLQNSWLQPVSSQFPPKPQLNHGSIRTNSERPEPSAEVVRRLLDVFVQRHVQCCFELDLNRVMGSLQHGTTKPIIPALYNAMLLIACHFTCDPDSKVWEGVFLERTKWEIENKVVEAHGGRMHNYNSLHHLAAMSLFGLYYYFKGRLLEGHVHTSQATRFAMTLGIHRLHSRIFREAPTPNMPTGQTLVEHWYPVDQCELAEAINVWWICCGLDMAGSALNGLPASISPEEITTVWPRLLSEYEPGQITPNDEYSVESLFSPQLYPIVTDASQDNIKCLLAKACILMISSAKLATEYPFGSQAPNEWWVRFEQVDRSVNRFMETMPPVYLGQTNEELAYLITAHSGIYCAQVQLHSTLAEYEIAQAAQNSCQDNDFLGGVSYTRCTEACRAAALAAALVLHIDMSNMLLFISVAWMSVSEVLIRDIPRLWRRGKVVQAREKEHQLAIIEKCMERAAETYPPFSK